MSGHTKGPWSVDDDGWVISHPAQAAVCMISTHTLDDREVADARLIAAAPDLLKELEATTLLLRIKRHACESTEVCHVLDVHIARNSAAIARAKGEQS